LVLALPRAMVLALVEEGWKVPWLSKMRAVRGLGALRGAAEVASGWEEAEVDRPQL